jgi:glutamyl-tRNA synthetase
VGNARTYLIAWLSARQQGGQVRIRIEDIDSPRIKAGAAELALVDLAWLGLDCDGEPIVQSARLQHYADALSRLRAAERVYPCTCTRAEVERSASAPHLDHEGPAYPGTCAGRRASDADRLDRPFCWRFRVPEPTPSFVDGYRGPCTVDLRQVGGDFVVWKAARTPAYQLSVVVDDAAQGVTEVVRGDDLVASTPRQLLLYDALGLLAPRFVHVPLVVGADGRRLAKRHGDTRLVSLRQAGIRPEMLVGLLAWSCGWLDAVRPITPRELLPMFRLETIPPAPFVLTAEHLKAIGYC